MCVGGCTGAVFPVLLTGTVLGWPAASGERERFDPSSYLQDVIICPSHVSVSASQFVHRRPQSHLELMDVSLIGTDDLHEDLV